MTGRQLELAVQLPGETGELAKVISTFGDQARKRSYADWLKSHGDSRGDALHRVLDAWESPGTEIKVDDSLPQIWRNTCGIRLLAGLRKGGLDRQADAICKMVRPVLELFPIAADAELPVGSTKFGGKPDLPKDAPWPEYEGKIHTFIGQINLADLSATQVAPELPSAGLLSFFIFDDPIEAGQPAAEGDLGAWFLGYFPDADQLIRRDPPKDFDEGNRLAPECALRARETLDLPYVNTYSLDSSYADRDQGCQRAKQLGLTKELGDAYEAILESLLPEREEHSHLLGWSHPQVVADDPVDPGYRNLLTVASEEALEWCWADEHQLYFSLSEEDLAGKRFDRSAIIDG